MKRILLVVLFASVVFSIAEAQNQRGGGRRGGPRGGPFAPPNADDIYQLTEDAYHQEGVPEGEVVGPLTLKDKAYEGYSHRYWVYVPRQYAPNAPAALTIFLDGYQYLRDDYYVRARHVLDNLIHKDEIPVTIAIFVNPGHREDEASPGPGNSSWQTSNRATEYISTNGKFANYLAEELVPAVAEKYNLKDDPAARCIIGASQGGAGAFIAAWERPDFYGKVISHVGSFVGGPHIYPEQVMALEAPKPIRISMQENAYDNANFRNLNGDWVTQNLRLFLALREKQHDVQLVWGQGRHSLVHGGVVLPDQMRWIWRDYPKGEQESSATQDDVAVPAGQP